ncbi:MAG: flavin reductase family protein [Proteobacteria bacterium]|nr:flavin reductase family protein [Pseudomonadota bacterium]
MPVLIVGANVYKKPNFITVAWSGVACGDPPMIAVAIRHSRYTLIGMRQNRTFSLNVPTESIVKETDFCGMASGAKVDKAAKCGFEVFYGKLGTAPMIAQCPASVECSVHKTENLGSHVLVIGKMEEGHVSESCLTAGRPDIDKMKTFVYTVSPEKLYRSVGAAIAQAFSAGREIG